MKLFSPDIIYFDNSATTRPFDEVSNQINNINQNIYGNPSSLHRMGIEAEKLIKNSREQIAKSLNAQTSEIIFNSGGSEGNNHCIRGYLEANPRKGKAIVTSEIEHPSILEAFKYLEKSGYTVNYVKVDCNGVICLDDLKEKINANTSLLSFMLVNNETGVIQPYEEIIKVAKSINKEICIHSDCVQAYGKIRLNPAKMGFDLLTLSGHKIHGPKGIGAIYKKKGIKLSPLIYGGGQESNFRSGTENVSGISGFGLAAEIIHNDFDHKLENIKQMKMKLSSELENEIPYASINIDNSISVPHILSISFQGLKAEVILHYLETNGIYVSTGSACSSRKNLHSHVFTAMKKPINEIEGTLRISFGHFNSLSEIDVFISQLKEIILKMKKLVVKK